MHGYGIYIHTNGVRYEGCYSQDLKSGFGKYWWSEDRYYEGYWYKG